MPLRNKGNFDFKRNEIIEKTLDILKSIDGVFKKAVSNNAVPVVPTNMSVFFII